MTKYRSLLRQRALWMLCGGIVLLLITAFGTWYALRNVGQSHAQDFTRGMQTGLLIVAVGVLVLSSVQSMRALRNEALLKKLYTEETDERNRFIRDKIGGLGMDLSMFLLAAATILAGFFDFTVFITLAAVLLMLALVKAGLKLYYRGKY